MKTIKRGNLPSIASILSQLKERLRILDEEISQSSSADEEIIFSDEYAKTKILIEEIENHRMQESSDNDIIVENSHAALELKYLQTKKNIETKISKLQLLDEYDLLEYNNAVHKYNLFNNVLESLY